MGTARTPPHERAARWLGRFAPWAHRLGLAVAVLAAVYLAAMNLFLGTRLFRNLISFDPETFRVEYARAYSLLPGQLHVEGLAIRGRDGSIEWILNLDRCDFRVSFFDLTHRLFHASHVRGHGLSFRVRLRVTTEAVPEHLAALPPVPGFSDPPFQDSAPPTPPLTDANYKLWGALLDDVDADPVRELWIDTIRCAGDLRVRGRWLFHPVRWLEVGPAVVDARAVDISYGLRPLVTGASGVVHATAHPFDVRIPQGLEMLDYVSARVDLHGHLRAADVLQALGPAGAVLTRGEGPFDVALAVDHGVLAPGGHVSTEAPDTVVSAMGVTFEASARVNLDVTRDAEGRPTGTVHALASGLRASRENGAAALAGALALTATSRELKLAHAFGEDAILSGDLADAVTESLQPWLSGAPQLGIESGRATAKAHVEGSRAAEQASGRIDFSVNQIKVAPDGIRASAAVVAGVAEGSASLALEKLSGRVNVEAEGLTVQHGQTRSSAALSAHIAGDCMWRDGTMDLTRSDVALSRASLRVGRAELRAPSITLTTDNLRKGDGTFRGSVDLDIPRVTMADVAAAADIVPFPKDVTIDRGSASGAIHLRLDLPSRAASGAADIDVRRFGAHLASKELFGDLELRVRALRQGDLTSLSGTTLAFETVQSTSQKDDPAGRWWARADLSQFELRAASALAFQGHVHFMAADASPISALIASETPIPKWVLAAVPMNGLDAAGDVRAGPSRLEVRSLAARGGSDRVELEYASRSTRTDWALLVEAGAIGTSFHMHDGHMDFVLFNARSWYDDKVATLRESGAE